MRYTENNIPDDLKVHIRHLHKGNSTDEERTRTYDYSDSEVIFMVHPYITQARLLKKDEVVSRAEAACGQFDSPNRKIGRQIAIGRALKQYHGLR